MDLLFPIKDEASAMLMVVKAERLHEANVISDDDRLEVLARAAAFRPRAKDCGRLWVTRIAPLPPPAPI
jgi:hypothetical protein